MTFQVQPIGKPTAKDLLAQAAELPLERVLIFGFDAKGGLFVSGNAHNFDVLSIHAHLLGIIVRTDDAHSQDAREITGPEDLKK